MFICKNCKSVDKFELMFSPDYHGDKQFSQRYNDKNEIVMAYRLKVWNNRCDNAIRMSDIYNIEKGSDIDTSVSHIQSDENIADISTEDIENECANIIFDCLGNVKTDNGTPLLYRGAMR